MKQFAILLALIGFGLGACERHDWESKPGKPGTEELFKHAPEEKKEGDHGHDKDGGHGEKKDAH